MSRSQFSEGRIIEIPKERQAGHMTAELLRKTGKGDATS